MFKFFYGLLNLFFMLIGILVERKVFIVFGGLGFFGYLGHLSWTVFKDSMLFPFALTALGLAIICLGWFYHKNQEHVIKAVYEHTPQRIINILPQNHQTK